MHDAKWQIRHKKALRGEDGLAEGRWPWKKEERRIDFGPISDSRDRLATQLKIIDWFTRDERPI